MPTSGQKEKKETLKRLTSDNVAQRRQVPRSRNRRSILHPDTTEPSAHTREPEQHRSVQPQLSPTDTHARSARSLMGLCLGELFLSAVYERQHVRESTCPRIARVPLAGSPVTAHAIGRPLQPVVAARVCHWSAVRALTVLPTHVSPVCTVSRGASRAYYCERGVNTRTRARTQAHARALRPPTPVREMHNMFYAFDGHGGRGPAPLIQKARAPQKP